MPDVAGLGIEVDSRQVKEAAKDLKKLEEAGGKAETATGKLEKSSKKLGTALKGLATVAFATIIVKQFVDIAAASVQLASDLQETQGKFDVVFRGMTDQAEEWSDTLQDSYQMAEEESKRYLSSIQDLLVPTGMAREQAGAMSNEFVKLAADLASFNNLPTATVVRDIQSALAGGSETLTKYGIDVKVAAVKQEAFNLGLYDGEGAISSNARAQAILSLAYKDSADAIGDAIRTQDSYANQTKQLTANVTDFKASLGDALLPVLTDVVAAMNEWYEENGELLQQDIAAFVEGVATAIDVLATSIGVVVEGMTWLIDGFREVENFSAAEERIGAINTELEALRGELEELESADLLSKIFAQFTNKTNDQRIIETRQRIDELEAELREASSAANALEVDMSMIVTSASMEPLIAEIEKVTAANEDAGKSASELAEEQCEANKKALTCTEKAAAKRVKAAQKAAKEEEKAVKELHESYIEAAEGITDNWQIQAEERGDVARRSLQVQAQLAEEAAQEEIDAQEEATAQIIEFREGMTNDMAAIFDDYLTDVLTGQVESFSDMFEDLFNTILDMFIRMISQMVAEWAAAGIIGMLSGEGLGGFSMPEGLESVGGMLSTAVGGASTVSGALGGPTIGSAATSAASALGIGSAPAVTPYVAGTGQALGSTATTAAVAEGVEAGIASAATAAESVSGAGFVAGEGAGGFATYGGGTGGSLTGSSTTAASASLMAPALMAGAAALVAIIGKLTPSVSMFKTSIESLSGRTLELTDFAWTLEEAQANFNDPAWVAAQLQTTQSHGTNVLGETAFTDDYGMVNAGVSNTISGAYEARQTDTHLMAAETEGGSEQAAAVAQIADSLFQKLSDSYTALEIAATQYGDELSIIALSMGDSLGHFDSYVDAVAGVDVSMDASASMMDLASQAAKGNANAHSQLMDALMAQGLSAQQASDAAAQMAAVLHEGSAAASDMAGAVSDFSNTDLNLEATAKLNVEVEGDADVSGSVGGGFSVSSGSSSGMSDGGGSSWSTGENALGAIYDYHARGGVMNEATVFHIGGERGSEAIMPLHAGPKTLEKMHDDIKAGNNQEIHNHFYVDGKEISTTIMPAVDEHVAARNSRGLTTERAVY